MATFLPEHLGNCDNDYFNFHHSFHIITSKFWKIGRVKNFVKKYLKLQKAKERKYEIDCNRKKLSFNNVILQNANFF